MIKHIPVLPRETIKYLAPQENQNFIDATCGQGGHSKLILQKNGPAGRVLAIDQDQMALVAATKNLKNFSERVDFVQSNFTKLSLIVRAWDVNHIDGIIFDLGVSTYQLKTPERGFSFHQNAELDMRMAPTTQKLSAKEIVNSRSERDLRRILRDFGEEPFAGKISSSIVKARRIRPLVTTNQLLEIIKHAMPPKYRYKKQKHFATATFRALRMAVNDELNVLVSGLKQAIQILSPGGKMVVISFHSLEDKIVKNFFKENNLEILTKKPVVATPYEIVQNPSARSAKLRAAKKLKI